MTATLRKSLISAAIAAFVGSSAWAADMDADKQSQTPGATPGQMSEPAERSAAAGTSASTSNPLYSLTPQQLRRMDVVDVAGEDVGTVKSVVRSPDQQDIKVVISSGGFLGLGAKEVAVSLDDLQLVDEKLHLSSTKEELQARGEAPTGQYVELQPADQPISDFAAFEPTPDDPARTPSPSSTPSDTPSSAPMGEGTPSKPERYQ